MIYSNEGTSISNSVIFGSGGDGVRVEGDYYSSTTVAVTNCIISDNGGYAIYNESPIHNVTISYSNMWNNSKGNYSDKNIITIGSGIIEKDPQFVDPGMDFHLKQGSPCIDAGKPGFASLDPDGTRNDMGAYGGPYAKATGIIGPIIMQLEVTPTIIQQGGTITIKAKGTIR